MMNLTNFIVNG